MAFLKFRGKNKYIRGAIYCVLSIFLRLLCFVSCVPTPTENVNVAPRVTDLHSFYIPQNIHQTNLWRAINLFPHQDTIYFFEYKDPSSSISSEGYSPIWQVKNPDTLSRNSILFDAYISDSLVEVYAGNSKDPMTGRQIRLRDTLRVGATWVAADNYLTANGARVQINAKVEDYYSETDNKFKDVFLVSYTSKVKGLQNPVELQYQNGSRVNRYYARDIGAFLEICKDFRDSVFCKSELIETRIR